MAAAQYREATTLHSLFRLGIDEDTKSDFRSNIGKGTARADYLTSAHLIVIDEVSMLTPWVARRASLTLQALTDEPDLPFGGKKVLFVGDLLQLPPVVKKFGIPVSRRLFVRLPWWGQVKKYILTETLRSVGFTEWNDFVKRLAKGQTDPGEEFWDQIKQKFDVSVTRKVDDAMRFYCDELDPANPFPLDRLWVSPTNKLVSDVNQRIQEWRAKENVKFPNVIAATRLVHGLRDSHGIAEAQQVDFIEGMDPPDLPPHSISLCEGDPVMLMRNINTSQGLVKGRRCTILKVNLRSVVVRLDDGKEVILARMPLQKSMNGMTFIREQIPIRLIFAGTVHRAQGMTLSRSVVDLRSQLWEHGQLYVGLSRVRDPSDLCILLPETDQTDKIDVPVDTDIVQMVSDIENGDESSFADLQMQNTESFPNFADADGPFCEMADCYISESEDHDDQLKEISVQYVPLQKLLHDVLSRSESLFRDSMVVPESPWKPRLALVHTLTTVQILLARFLVTLRCARRYGFRRLANPECLSTSSLEWDLCNFQTPDDSTEARESSDSSQECQEDGDFLDHSSHSVCLDAHIGTSRIPLAMPVLVNTHYDCYMNAFVQILYHLPGFRDRLLGVGSNFFVTQNLQRILSDMQNRGRAQTISLGGLLEANRKGPKDITEFADRVLSELSRDPALTSYIRESFEVILQDDGSGDANNQSVSFLLGVGIIGNSVARCVHARLHSETGAIAGCAGFVKLPNVLFIALARTDWADGKLELDTSFVSVEQILDLSGYVVAGSASPNTTAEFLLFSVIVHTGTVANDGHFISYCNIGGRWLCFNDLAVSVVADEEVPGLATTPLEENVTFLTYLRRNRN